MPVEVTIPHVGESVQEAVLAEWVKQDGEVFAVDGSRAGTLRAHASAWSTHPYYSAVYE